MPDIEHVAVQIGGTSLSAELRPGPGPAVLFLHAGVSDRRSWHQVMDALAGEASLIAYDRRGFGETPPAAGDFSELDDLLAVLDHTAVDEAILVGCSAGGRLALDAAVAAPDRVGGLLLIGAGVSGGPEFEGDPATGRLVPQIERAFDAGEFDEVNRLEAWLWLDGPAQPEGRVGGPPRELFLEMNRIVIANEGPEGRGATGVDAWAGLERISAPAIVACGDYDVTFIQRTNRGVAERIPGAQHCELRGVAHLPQLEQPELVAGLVREALRNLG